MVADAVEIREDWPKPLIIKCLREYQRMVITHRMAPREERLSSSPPPQSEATFSATARMLADLERALQRQPYQNAQITFMAVCMGESSWRSSERFGWRKRVSEWWGMDAPGEVWEIVERTIDALHADLNRTPAFPVY